MNRTHLVLHGLRMLMPFIDRIAWRALWFLVALVSAGTLLFVGCGVTRAFTSVHIAGWLVTLVASQLFGSLIGFRSFIVLFALFAQSRGISSNNREVSSGQCTRSTSAARS